MKWKLYLINQMKILNNKSLLGFSLFLAVILSACGEAQMADEAITKSNVKEKPVDEDSQKYATRVQEIFYSVPSPMEMASLLKQSGAEYEMKLLNDIKSVDSYTTARRKALNLGVYGADLSYASIFNQNQESIIYLSCTKKLADKLGVTKAFDENTIERMEANVENRDSLLNIVSETYYMLDGYLKENGRDHISAMVIAAGWVEGLYLATTIAERGGSDNEKLMQRIAEQKLSLDNLRELVKAYNKDDQLNDILGDLEKINTAFRDVKIEKEKATVNTGSDGVATIGGKTNTSISAESLKEISEIVSDIRTRYIS
jgi:hypothetical protein